MDRGGIVFQRALKDIIGAGDDGLGPRIVTLIHDVATVAMANKLARIAWAALTRKERFNPTALLSA